MKRWRMFFFITVLALVLPAAGTAKDKITLPDFLTGPGERTGRRCVMGIFGHFDDDSVIAGTLNMYLRAGWEVHEVWLTSAGMGEGSMWGTVEERYHEAMRVADIMGIPPENRQVLGIADRDCVNHLPAIADMVTGLVRKYQPSVIITCAYEGGHWDHDASCLAAWVAAQRVDFEIVRFEVPTYNASGPWIMPFRTNGFIKAYGPPQHVILDSEAWQMRRKVRYGYRSQWFLMIPSGLIFGYRHLKGKGEPIRETPDYDFTKPPHPGTLLIQHPVVGALRGAPFSWWEEGVRSIPEFE